MKAEAENSFMSDNDEMTPAEIAYISAMEDVKDLSKKHVIAEKAFQLVRDRIENLISKYEEMLVKLETETWNWTGLNLTGRIAAGQDGHRAERDPNQSFRTMFFIFPHSAGAFGGGGGNITPQV